MLYKTRAKLSRRVCHSRSHFDAVGSCDIGFEYFWTIL